MSDEPFSPAWKWQVTNHSMPLEPDAPEADRGVSWVRCSVEGQPGAAVHLAPAEASLDAAVLTEETGSRPDYGPFFCELGPLKAGWYRLEVEGIGIPIDLWLDGRASAAVAFAPVEPLAPPESVEKLPHVLLLGQLMGHQGNFLALTRYVAKFGAVVTFDPQEAARAGHAILIGSTALVGADVEQRLQAAGVRVERAQGDIAARLDAATNAETPFLSP